MSGFRLYFQLQSDVDQKSFIRVLVLSFCNVSSVGGGSGGTFKYQSATSATRPITTAGHLEDDSRANLRNNVYIKQNTPQAHCRILVQKSSCRNATARTAALTKQFQLSRFQGDACPKIATIMDQFIYRHSQPEAYKAKKLCGTYCSRKLVRRKTGLYRAEKRKLFLFLPFL